MNKKEYNETIKSFETEIEILTKASNDIKKLYRPMYEWKVDDFIRDLKCKLGETKKQYVCKHENTSSHYWLDHNKEWEDITCKDCGKQISSKIVY